MILQVVTDKLDEPCHSIVLQYDCPMQNNTPATDEIVIVNGNFHNSYNLFANCMHVY